MSSENPEAWMRRLGATRPMAVAANVVLVLGTWCDHFYPIEYCKSRGLGEQWFLFGHRVEPLTEADVVRIMKQVKTITAATGTQSDGESA